MRTLITLFLMTCLFLTLGVAGEDKKDVRRIEVSGMNCDNCSAKVEKALSAIKGVEKVVVDREKGEAYVTVAAKASLKTETLVNAIAKAGYGAKVGKISATPTETCDDECNDGDAKDSKKTKSGKSDSDDCCATKKKQ